MTLKTARGRKALAKSLASSGVTSVSAVFDRIAAMSALVAFAGAIIAQCGAHAADPAHTSPLAKSFK